MITKGLERMIISDAARIEGLFEAGFDSDSLQPNSYDVRIGVKGLKGGMAEEQPISASTPITMEPGSYVAVISAEKVKLPNNVCAIIGAKRNLSYDGIILLTGMQVHPGYEGYFVFGLFNASGKSYLIQFEQKLCSVTFFEVEPVADSALPKPDRFLSKGDFSPEFKRKFAEFKTPGWMSLEQSVSTVSTDLATLKAEVTNLRAKIDDIHEPIRQLTEQVDRVTRDVETVNESVKQTAENLTKLSEKHGDLAKEVAEKKGANTVFQAIVLILITVVLTLIGTAIYDRLKPEPTTTAQTQGQPPTVKH